QRRDLAFFGLGSAADGDDFALLRLFLRRIRDDDPAGGLLVGLDTADEDAVMKRPECHKSLTPLLYRQVELAVGTLTVRVPAMAAIWLSAVHPSTPVAADISGRNGYGCAARVRPRRSRISQRANISTATEARPVASPI